jgi:hypothetical protein
MSDRHAKAPSRSPRWLTALIVVGFLSTSGVAIAGEAAHWAARYAAVSLSASEVPAAVATSGRYMLANGLDVTVHTADDLAARLTKLGDKHVIPLDGSRYVRVITDINDPSISNKGDGKFHPFEISAVIDALAKVSHPSLRIPVTVYILPYPRESLLVSSTSGAEIFLSPHVLDIPTAVSAYIVTHELGHAFHNRYLPGDSRGWDEYRRLRGIENEYVYAESAAHANRPKEIFAEDFRVLFGGIDAAWEGHIENTALIAPEFVVGLEDFMRSIGGERTFAPEAVAATSVPNPFNPDTEIRVSVPDDVLARGNTVSVRVYDVRGALVKELYSDVPSDLALSVRWDGTDGNGNSVASGQYFAQIRAGQHKATLKLVMLK